MAVCAVRRQHCSSGPCWWDLSGLSLFLAMLRRVCCDTASDWAPGSLHELCSDGRESTALSVAQELPTRFEQ